MKKIAARIIMLVLVFFIIVSLTSEMAVAYVPSGADIYYWYCDTNDVGYWSISQIKTYVSSSVSMTSLSVSNIKTYLNTAFSKWNCTGRTISYVNNISNANLIVRGITRATANSYGYPSNVVGITIPTKQAVGQLYLNGVYTKTLYKITGASVDIIYETTYTDTTSGAKKVIVHEIGHALGYLGHYNSGTVMTATYENITSITPSTNENQHLSQIYN